jgi:hypothetical protein
MIEIQELGIAAMIIGATILAMGAVMWAFGVLVK